MGIRDKDMVLFFSVQMASIPYLTIGQRCWFSPGYIFFVLSNIGWLQLGGLVFGCPVLFCSSILICISILGQYHSVFIAVALW